MILLPFLNTCTDLISPSSPWLKTSAAMHASLEEVKVIVSVAVEGSPGPVRAMVRLGASIEEAIGVVVRQYGSEGRSPKLDLQAAASFQLHHSHFTLQSLKKSDKIGEVGGRSFYLRTNTNRYGPNSGTETNDGGFYTKLLNEIDRHPSTEQNFSVSFCSHPFLAAIALKFNAFERRTKKICRIMACFLCA
ncbi:hypothetical protein KSP40_PGU016865 [Platanthera guangdongensis]|uniref:DUF7054 domain-containing protein n=1 Tax=Platanthera guangdongensis TaxID=2320717 RepID=A0ABR2MMQ4_9ASPA